MNAKIILYFDYIKKLDVISTIMNFVQLIGFNFFLNRRKF
jgi:hypothetical protein